MRVTTAAQSIRCSAALKALERWILLVHRWVGIAACLLFVIWGLSGLVMMYVGFPKLTPAEEVEHLAPVAWEEVRITPTDALTALGLKSYPKDFRLEMSAGRPVYRVLGGNGGERAVSAVTGREIDGVSPAEAEAIAARFAGGGEATWTGQIQWDQWSFRSELNSARPLHRIDVADPAGSRIYVSARTGRVVLETTRRERGWNWVGSVPHLLYVGAIGVDNGLWRRLLLWTVGPGTFVTLTGLWLGISRLRLGARGAKGRISPFRGWMEWHHVLGVVGGVFLCFWMVSAWIYLRPAHFLERTPIAPAAVERYTGHAAPNFPALPSSHELAARPATLVRFRWLAGRPLLQLERPGGDPVVLDPASAAPVALDPDWLAGTAQTLAPDVPYRAEWLTRPDEYWHTFKETSRQLPVLRVRFEDKSRNWYYLAPDTGEILSISSADDRAFRWTFNGLHKFDFLPLLRLGVGRDVVEWALMLAAIGICVTGAVVGWRRLERNAVAFQTRRFSRSGVRVAGASEGAAPPAAASTGMDVRPRPGHDEILLAVASQTGVADRLARAKAKALRAAGFAVDLEELGRVDDERLRRARFALFVASTTGEGDAPDNALRFFRRMRAPPLGLQSLQFGVLALGDREYTNFCAFGRRLNAWLLEGGARAAFSPVEVDKSHGDALRQWDRCVAEFTGVYDASEGVEADFAVWRLAARRLLNPGSTGEGAFHIELAPRSGIGTWTAGDIAEIRIGADVAARPSESWAPELAQDALAAGGPGPARQFSRGPAADDPPSPRRRQRREYSIASVPEDGRLHLLVRQRRNPDGSLGAGSSWLTRDLPMGGDLVLRVRPNPAFHPPGDDRPMILVGNGTGIAGLRAHLRHRALRGFGRCWLLFGERNRAIDYFFADEIEGWRASGLIERLDLAFSRDLAEKVYVQDLLRANAPELRRWMAAGAAIYMCGSIDGMAHGVTAVLREVLGVELVDELIHSGRFRRDVY